MKTEIILATDETEETFSLNEILKNPGIYKSTDTAAQEYRIIIVHLKGLQNLIYDSDTENFSSFCTKEVMVNWKNDRFISVQEKITITFDNTKD